MHDELVHVALHATHPESGAARTSLAGIVADLAQPVQVVDADLPIRDVNLYFRDPEVSCVVVRRSRPTTRVGILMRQHFTWVYTGRLGYGRAMHDPKPVSMVTDWSPLVAHPASHVADVAAQVMVRDAKQRYDDVLVQDTRWGVTSAAAIMRALVGALSERSTHDPLTRLKTRAAIWYDLTRRCDTARPGTAQFLLLFDVEGLHRVNAAYGLAAGDQVLIEVASRLVGALPAGSEIGRVDGGTFAVVISLPAVDDVGAAMSAESLRQRFADALAEPPRTLPHGAWPRVRGVVSWATTPSSAESLVLDAETRMRERRNPFA
ncbi:GGDEF domain-containing protein [Myceligenerans crystallogenes]|uniref:GGDEF domain-containing protein n=1 Tax=Myceligenerans crystallogenes TaxID=316335 RepID=A0ABN2N5H9_9MICO